MSELPIGTHSAIRLDEIKYRHVMVVLKSFNGNKAKAARALDINRNTLYNILKKHKES